MTAVNGQAANAGVQVTLASGALLTLNADGSYTYDPNGQFESLNAGDSTADSFTYEVSDGHGGSDTATVNLTITGVTDGAGNTPPVAVDDSYSVHAGEVLNVNAALGLLANDSDADGDPLSVLAVAAPANGTLNIATDGSFEYTPNAGFVGSEVLTYTISDGTTTTSAEVTIAVENQAPVAALSAEVTSGRAPLSVGFSAAQSSDPDGDLLSFEWDFGDGTTATSSGPAATHVYDSAGRYTAAVTVSDGSLSDSAAIEISVLRPRRRR